MLRFCLDSVHLNPAEISRSKLQSVLTTDNSRYRLPRWFSDKESTCNAGYLGDVGSIPGQEEPLEEKWQQTPVFLPGGKSHGQEPGGL